MAKEDVIDTYNGTQPQKKKIPPFVTTWMDLQK